MHVVTVATVSHLYKVDVLLNSVNKFHPDAKRSVLVADCTRQRVSIIQAEFDSNITFLCTDDLNEDSIDVMRNYYSPLEFCAALKVLVCRYILQTYDECLFLDSDTLLLDSILDSFSNIPGDVILSPHCFTPYPVDQYSPNDLELCYSGHINAGVFLTRKSSTTNHALEWLAQKTRLHFFVAPEYGMHAEQQWFTSLIFFFSISTALITDLGINVAYWNLHERCLEKSASGKIIIKSTNQPLRLFHFSGFPLPSNGALSIHTSRLADMRTQQLLLPLIKSYESDLLKSWERLKFLDSDLPLCSHSLKTRIKTALHQSEDIPLFSFRLNLIRRAYRRFRSIIGFNFI